MTDVFGKRKRSAIMSAIRAKNTMPEISVRRALRRLKARYRSHVRSLPGTPDFVLPECRTALFVHGCFWHQHKGCRRLAVPKSNRRYWVAKLKRNVERFQEVQKDLRKEGWKVLVVWECQAKDAGALITRLGTKLGGKSYD